MIKILDTTLREGEQTPGVTFSIEEKLKISEILDEFGVDIIEAGHPQVSDDVYQAIKLITNQNYNSDILVHSRARIDDVDKAISCNADWIGIFLCVNEERLEKQFKVNLNEAIEKITSSVEYAKSHGLQVRYTFEDATRTDFETIKKVLIALEDVHPDRVSIADTVGFTTPFQMYQLIKKIKKISNFEINVHCHNDLGLATANSLAAYEAGATLIDVTVNGLGERVGITSLSELCLSLNCLYKISNNWRLDLLQHLSKTVEDYSGLIVNQNTPIVGKNAFSHKAGLHVAAVLKDPSFYETFPAELIGRNRDITLDKMAGKETVIEKIKSMGLNKKDNAEKLLKYVKSKEKGTVTDAEIRQILNFDNCFFQKCI
jgi:2-isopropylmalate synthase